MKCPSEMNQIGDGSGLMKCLSVVDRVTYGSGRVKCLSVCIESAIVRDGEIAECDVSSE